MTRRVLFERRILQRMALAVAGCGGGDGGHTTATSPDAPVIANLSGQLLLRNSCTTEFGGGSVQLLLLDYANRDGNVLGGRVEVTGLFSVTRAQPRTVTFEVPSQTVSTTGTTSRQIAVAVCITFGGTREISEPVALFDGANNRSHQLGITVATPAGSAEAGRRT